jgi:SHS2 domain-containing protein
MNAEAVNQIFRYTDIMKAEIAGYREIEHTADWELQVWAPDLPALLETAACGMYALAHITLRESPRTSRTFELPIIDRESILVDFLAELLFLEEEEGLAFDQFYFYFNGNTLKARVEGAPIRGQTKEIKAVTYHRLQIRETGRGLEVNIVFDV